MGSLFSLPQAGVVVAIPFPGYVFALVVVSLIKYKGDNDSENRAPLCNRISLR